MRQNGASSDSNKKGYSANLPCRVYCDGVFDLFHYGHARALEQAKKLYPHTTLIVGVCTDADTLYHKGKTVMPQNERVESVRACKWVDEIIQDTPWVPWVSFLDKHNIDFVAHDAIPYASDEMEDVYAEVKAAGRFAETQRTEGVSTSDLILRIIRDYNEYVVRNLSRGYNRKDLGLSLLKEQRIKAEMAVGEMRRNLSQNLSAIKKSVSGNKLWRYERNDQNDQKSSENEQNEQNEQKSSEKTEEGASQDDDTSWMEEIGSSMDATLTGFIQNFERGYRQFERALSSKLKRLSSPDAEQRRKKSAKGGVKKKQGHGPKKHHQGHGLTTKSAL